MKGAFVTCAVLASCLAHAAPALRDPFARPAATVVAGPAPVIPAEPPRVPELRAVVLAGSRALANIDGTVVTVGDTVAGWRVIRIAERTVVLDRAEAHITISLKGRP